MLEQHVMCVVTSIPFSSFIIKSLPLSNMFRLIHLNRDNIFINTNTTDGNLIIQRVGAGDEGNYICEIIAANQKCTETQIVKLHIGKYNSS